MSALSLSMAVALLAVPSQQPEWLVRGQSGAAAASAQRLRALLEDGDRRVVEPVLRGREAQILAQARAKAARGRKLFADLEVMASLEVLKEAASGYEGVLASEAHARELVDTLAVLAAGQLLLDQHRGAQITLERLWRVEPNYAPDEKIYNPTMMAFYDRFALRFRDRPEAVLSVDSQPSGAALAINGRWVGVSPMQLSRPRGKHRVRFFKEGFEPRSLAVDFRPGARLPPVRLKTAKGAFVWDASELCANALGPAKLDASALAKLKESGASYLAMVCAQAPNAAQVYGAAGERIGTLSFGTAGESFAKQVDRFEGKVHEEAPPEEAKTFRYSGRICAEGAPVPGGKVELQGPGGFFAMGTTEPNGDFRLQDVPEGEHRVRVSQGKKVLLVERRNLRKGDQLALGYCGKSSGPSASVSKGWLWVGYGLSGFALAYGGYEWIQADQTYNNAQAASVQTEALRLQRQAYEGAKRGDVAMAAGAVLGLGTGTWHFLKSR